jgi:cell division protease FtsH
MFPLEPPPSSPRRRSPLRPEGPQLDWRNLIGPVVLFFLVAWLWQEGLSQLNVKTIPYSEFKQLLAEGKVVACSIGESQILGRVDPARHIAGNSGPAVASHALSSPASSASERNQKTPSENSAPKPYFFRTTRVDDPNLTAELEAAKIEFTGARPGPLSVLLASWGVPIGIMLIFWLVFRRIAGSASQSILSFGRSRARLLMDKDAGVSFADVAGADEAKFELEEVVEFLRNPERYQELGAKIPKGVLLVGPPGTGKTLLARAVAGEAKVPFFLLSGSDFVEMFVGVGASRVRDLFRQAKARAPCIVFIDELDAIGRQRGVRLSASGNDEREQTLNQLLVEMDGFDPNQGVILLAATNRPEVLDRALLRPGRFDRLVVVDAPDIDGREAILRVHAKGKPLAPEVDLREIASATAGFSGADLANLINEAALLAGRNHAHEISQHHFQDAFEKVVAGPERKSRRLAEAQKRRVAYHEVGHALIAAFTEHGDRVTKISIVPRGRAALGYTLQLPTEQQFLMTRAEILDRVTALLGGRAAEELVSKEITTGAENDLQRATAMVRQMICIYGMSETIGLAHLVQHPAIPYFNGTNGSFLRDCSDETAYLIDKEVKQLLDQTYNQAKSILTQHRDLLESIGDELLKRESLDGATFYRMAGVIPPTPEEAQVARRD